MLKRCFIAVLLGLFSPTCAVFAATAPEISVRWKSQVSVGAMADVQAFVGRKYPGVIFATPTEADEKLLKTLIAKVDRAYRELFPELLRNKSVPDYAVIESSNWTDIQILNETDLSADSNRGVLMVPSGLLRDLRTRGEAGLLSLLAHELAHLYLHHNSTDQFILEAKDSRSGKPLTKERLQAFREFLDDSMTAGAGFSTGFAGQPFGISYLRDDFRDLLTQLLTSNPRESCAVQSFHQYKVLMVPLFNSNFSDAEGRSIFHDQMQELTSAALVEGFQNELLQCSSKLSFKSEQLQKRSFSFRARTLNSAEFIALRLGRPFRWKGQDELAVLLELSKKIHNDMRASYEAYRLHDVQWRSFEDEADDFAIAVMRKLGLRAEDFTGMLLEILETTKTGAQMACRSAIAAQIEIPYGSVTAPHHAMCWRVNEFEKRFSAGTGKSIQLLKSE